MFIRSAIAVVILGGCALAQQPSQGKGARALYYFGKADREAMPRITRTSASTGGSRASRARAASTGKSAAAEPQPAAPPQVAHLGLRYNLVLVDAASRTATAVDSDRNFRKGECFAIDFESNRSGYLYVLAQQSSGNWMPLFPSPQMVGETNVINPGQKVRVPAQYCFEIDDPPGIEKVFVVLSRDPREVESLHEGISLPEKPPAEQAAGTFQIADSRRVNGEVARFSQATLNRDLKIVKIAEPESAQETPHSVYVVSASEKPQSRVVTEIQVKHR
jgi:hypothetical protein